MTAVILVAFGGRRQRIQLGLVDDECGPELGFVRHAVGVQLGAVNRDMLDPAGPRILWWHMIKDAQASLIRRRVPRRRALIDTE